MCTAFQANQQGRYFGRNLDLDRSLGEQVLFTPRQYPLHFRETKALTSHLAILGMGVQGLDFPLYYDAVNEQGLCMAGLNFPGFAAYQGVQCGRVNVAPFELIPWVLGQCATVSQAKTLLASVNLADVLLHPQVGQATLHWLISGEDGSLVVEPREDGLHLYEDPVQVLTNSPPFPQQLFQLNNFRHLRTGNPQNTFAPSLPLENYCQGLGAMGLPGDVSSMSRFVRAAFYLHNSLWDQPVEQVFHILDTVKMLRGSCRTELGTWDETVYSACIDADRGRYYYTTYGCRRIHYVDMGDQELEDTQLRCFALESGA